jgi:hypothetical protein
MRRTVDLPWCNACIGAYAHHGGGIGAAAQGRD